MALRTRSPTCSVDPMKTDFNDSAQDRPEEAMNEKEAQILSACRKRDLESLVNLATSKPGLINDNLRRAAWPILLGCNDDDSDALVPWRSLPPHRDEEQTAKDVNRAFVHYPKESDKQLDRRKEELSNVIVEVLRRHPSLCYFQGFHDIAQVLYLVLGPQIAPPVVTRLSLLRIRDYMLPDLDPAIRHLKLLPAIIEAEDPALYHHLPKIPPNYALGATLTLFSHVIEAYADITRLFDYFLASDTAVPVYFFASLLISRREKLFAIEKDDDYEAMFFVELGRLPQPFDLESQIAETIELYARVPPQSLRWPWWNVSSSSVLKANKTTYMIAHQTLDEGQALYRRQEMEVRMLQTYHKVIATGRQAKLQAWRHRRKGAVYLSLVVGIYALWLGRHHGGSLVGDIVKKIMMVIA